MMSLVDLPMTALAVISTAIPPTTMMVKASTATDGMGHRIIDAQISYSLTDMYGSILVAGAMGYGLNLALLFLERSVIHWSGK